MKKLFMLLPVLLLGFTAFSQQDNTTLVKAVLQQPDVVEYFQGKSLYAILTNDQCNTENTQADNIQLDKPVFIGTKEELFMRGIETFIQVRALSYKGKFAKARIYFQPKQEKTFRFKQLKEGWDPRTQLDDINR